MHYLLMTAAVLAMAPLPVAAQTADAGQHQSHKNGQHPSEKDPHAGHDMTAGCCAEKGEKAKADCCKKEDGKGCCDSRQKATAAPQAHQGH